MSYIKDDVPITKVVMPGSHNSGTRKMIPIACCQDGTAYEQFAYGVRSFCIKLNTTKFGNIVQSHAVIKGDRFEEMLKDIRQMMIDGPNEVFIFEIREYDDSQFGPFIFKSHVDSEKMNELMEKYIEPSKYAFTDFEDINKVTIGDIRNSGKRYILYNYKAEYANSVNVPFVNPWDPVMHGQKPEKFVRDVPMMYDKHKSDGFFSLQIQPTGSPGTEVGIKSPRKLDDMVRPHLKYIYDAIRNTPRYLDRANIIAGDFMTRDYEKSREIIKLNLDKNNVIEDKRDEFEQNL